jgi:hypothetical protein
MTALAEDLPESEGNRMAGSRSVTWRSRRLLFSDATSVGSRLPTDVALRLLTTGSGFSALLFM